MSLSLKLRGNKWQVTGTVNGHRVRESTGTADRSKAEQIRAEIEYEYLTGVRRQGETRKKSSRSFREATRLYQQSRNTGSSRTTDYTAGKLVSYFGQMDVDAIDVFAIERYINEVHVAKGNSNATIRRELGQIQAILNFAATMGLRSQIKLKKPPEDPNRTRTISEEEEKIIWPRISQELSLLATFILNTGARPSEALRLKWEDVNFDKNQVTLYSKKGRNRTWSARNIPLNYDALQCIRCAKSLPRDSEHVFTRNGKQWPSHWELDKQWKHTVKNELGIKDLNPYDLRHTFATRLARTGAPVKVIADLLGHSDLRMVMRYMNTDSSDMRNAVDALNNTVSLYDVS